MLKFIIAIIAVFVVGMLIRYLIRRRKRLASPPSEPAQPTKAGFCPQCGTPVELGSAFCGNCGAKLQ